MKKSDSDAYYHVCTDGNALEWMFKDDLDFIAGINRIGICSIGTSVEIIAYILMDNHVHFVLYGTMPNCKNFITKYKMLTGKWISNRYGLNRYLSHLPSQLIDIKYEEQLLETIAYIDRNSIMAGYGLLPGEYPWGSARFLFTKKIQHRETVISDMGIKKIKRTLNSSLPIPKDWTINSEGMIHPKCFLKTAMVERLFKTPARYLYYLSKKLEGKIELSEGTKSFIPDKELRPITINLAKQMFGKSDIKELDFNSRIQLARKLRYNYASTPKQISRMIYLDSKVLSMFI